MTANRLTTISPPAGPRRFLGTGGLIFAAALVLRLIYISQIIEAPFFDVPTLDAAYYHRWASRIAAGDWLGEGVFWMSPLYPYFWAVILKLFGQNWLVIRVAQACIGSLSCFLTYSLGRRLCNDFVGTAAGIMAALYGPFIFYDGYLLLSVLLTFLNLCLLLALIRAAEKASAARWLTAGMVLGLGGLTRASVLLFAPFAAWWIYRCLPGGERGKRAVSLLAFFLGAVFIISPVTVRNYLLGDDLVLITSNGGLNFYIGNNPHSQGAYSSFAHLGISADDPNMGMYEETYRYAEEKTGKKLKPSQVSAFWFSRGLAYIRRAPLHYARLLLKKIALFWNEREVSNIASYHLYRRFSSLLSLPLLSFSLVGPLALLGMGLSRRQGRGFLLACLFVLAYALSVAVFFVTARYRIPVVPVLLVFAAYSLYWFKEQLSRASYRRLVWPCCILALSGGAVNLKLTSGDLSAQYSQLGVIYNFKGGEEEAVRCFQRALEFNPDNALAHYNLGVAYSQRGEFSRAATAYEKALRLAPSLAVMTNLAIVYYQGGEAAKSIAMFKEAVRFAPRNPAVYRNLAKALQKEGRDKEALACLRRALDIAPGYEPARSMLRDIAGDTVLSGG